MNEQLARFTAWANDKFGPAPNPAIPQHQRYASLWGAWQAALAVQEPMARNATAEEEALFQKAAELASTLVAPGRLSDERPHAPLTPPPSGLDAPKEQ